MNTKISTKRKRSKKRKVVELLKAATHLPTIQQPCGIAIESCYAPSNTIPHSTNSKSFLLLLTFKKLNSIEFNSKNH